MENDIRTDAKHASPQTQYTIRKQIVKLLRFRQERAGNR
jgi:hypothetical protein